MRSLAAVSLLILLRVSAVAQQATQPLLGFTPQSETVERTWESKFLAIPDAKRVSDSMHLLAAHPYNVGSAAQRSNAEWLVKQYRSWGWDAKIEQFDVLYPTPKVRVLELLGSKPYKARLEEPPVPEGRVGDRQAGS
jgi:N-acetylated-alpha-linked acidic dipeptidase